MHSVYILWGETPYENEVPIQYEFDTPAEVEAFIYGLEQSAGWGDYTIADSAFQRYCSECREAHEVGLCLYDVEN